MTIENALHIDELVATSPAGTDDPFSGNEIHLEFQQLKDVLTTDFGSISGAVTATDVELNYLDLTTLGTTEDSKAVTQDASGNINAAATTWTNLGIVTTVDINGGTLDGVTISGSTINGAVGGGTPAAGAFTTLTASSTLAVTGAATFDSTVGFVGIGTTVNEFSIDGTLAGDSDDAVPTEKAVKTYADTKTTTAYVDARARTILNAVIADVSNSETVWVVVPVTGTITRVDTVLEGAITVADATVTVTTAASAAIASLVITQSGSAAGDVDSDTVLTNDSVTAGDALKVSTDGGSSTSQRLWVSITVDNS